MTTTSSTTTEIVEQSIVRNGLRNFGNTCWLNSILQAMLSVPSFQTYLDNSTYITNESGEPKQLLTNFVKIIFDSLYLQEGNHQYLNAFVNFVFQKTDLFEKYQQCDAHEFYVFVTDTIHEEIGKKITGCVKITNKKIDKDGIYYKAWQYRKKMLEEKYSFMHHHFYGISVSTMMCSCGHYSETYESFSTLQLPIPDYGNDENISIYDLLSDYSIMESMDDAKCESCEEIGGMYKEMRIAITPKILAIQIKRFDHTLRKNNARIAFPKYLNLEHKECDILIDPDDRVGSRRNNCYKLCSVVHHVGNINAGHYFAQVFDDDKCYICNDSRVIPFPKGDTSTGGIASPSPYMAFYESCSPSIVT